MPRAIIDDTFLTKSYIPKVSKIPRFSPVLLNSINPSKTAAFTRAESWINSVTNPTYPNVHPPSQETSDKVFQANHSVQNEESSNEIAVSNSNQEKEEPPQDFDICKLIREECSTEVSEEQKQILSPSTPNAPLKTPTTVATCPSSIDYKLKSPTSSTSPLTNSYLNSPMSPPPRVPPPPPTQESGSMYITLTISPITRLDIQFNTPSLFGHPIPWNLLEAHEDSCLCCIHNRTLIFGLRDELQHMFSYIEHMLSQPPPPNSSLPPSLSPN
nr:hypothetical protein [Tanacetum cinerariifolium]